jgi:hypothetical protein
MQRNISAAVILFALLCSAWLAGQSAAKPLTNQDIKDLVAVGFSSEVIIDKIHAAEVTNFDTSVEALKTLKAANVPDAIIRVMIIPHAVPTASPATPPASASGPQRVEPESVGAVYLLDSTDQTLKPLPKEAVKVVSGRKGFTGGQGSVQMPDPASSFRLTSGKDLEFVVRCDNPQSFELYEFERKGSNREAVVATAKGKLFGGASTQRVGAIPFAVTKYGDSSYRFVVTAPEPGEYGFLTGWSAFHFAVDSK